MQSCGIMVEAESLYFSSAKDNNHVLASRAYFGFIKEIMEIDYVSFKVTLFKCKWTNNNNGVEIDELGFTRISL